MNHIIGKLIIEIAVTGSEDVFRLQHEVSNMFWRVLKDEIEKVFDDLSDPQIMTSIEQMEIHSGKIPQKQEEEKKYVEEFSETLANELSLFLKESPEGVSQISLRSSQFDQWLYFLEFGVFSWSGNQFLPNWQKVILDTLALDITAVVKLRKLLKRSPKALIRIILQHPPDFLKTLIELYTGKKQDKLVSFINQYAVFIISIDHLSSFHHPKQPRLVEVDFWRIILTLAIKERLKEKPQNLIAKFIEKQFPSEIPAFLNQSGLKKAQNFPEILPFINTFIPKEQKGQKVNEPIPVDTPEEEHPKTPLKRTELPFVTEMEQKQASPDSSEQKSEATNKSGLVQKLKTIALQLIDQFSIFTKKQTISESIQTASTKENATIPKIKSQNIKDDVSTIPTDNEDIATTPTVKDDVSATPIVNDDGSTPPTGKADGSTPLTVKAESLKEDSAYPFGETQNISFIQKLKSIANQLKDLFSISGREQSTNQSSLKDSKKENNATSNKESQNINDDISFHPIGKDDVSTPPTVKADGSTPLTVKAEFLKEDSAYPFGETQNISFIQKLKSIANQLKDLFSISGRKKSTSQSGLQDSKKENKATSNKESQNINDDISIHPTGKDDVSTPPTVKADGSTPLTVKAESLKEDAAYPVGKNHLRSQSTEPHKKRPFPSDSKLLENPKTSFLQKLKSLVNQLKDLFSISNKKQSTIQSGLKDSKKENKAFSNKESQVIKDDISIHPTGKDDVSTTPVDKDDSSIPPTVKVDVSTPLTVKAESLKEDAAYPVGKNQNISIIQKLKSLANQLKDLFSISNKKQPTTNSVFQDSKKENKTISNKESQVIKDDISIHPTGKDDVSTTPVDKDDSSIPPTDKDDVSIPLSAQADGSTPPPVKVASLEEDAASPNGKTPLRLQTPDSDKTPPERSYLPFSPETWQFRGYKELPEKESIKGKKSALAERLKTIFRLIKIWIKIFATWISPIAFLRVFFKVDNLAPKNQENTSPPENPTERLTVHDKQNQVEKKQEKPKTESPTPHSLKPRFTPEDVGKTISKHPYLKNEAYNKIDWMNFEEIYVTNAGCIFLHPFLIKLFDNLELLEGDHFKNEQARNKAIYLIHFLATGETTAEEHELVLPKILCGLNPDDLVDANVELTEEEQEEADDLLDAAVGLWGALGEVSGDSLREAYLQRDGKLSLRDQGWNLQIEKKTMDILLNSLPWTIGVVKTPWMDQMMTTDWG